MKNIKLLSFALLPAATLAFPESLLAPPDPINRFGASFRTPFNLKVDFEQVGAYAPPTGLRLTPDGDPFNYDDGYVLVDSTGNLMGYTRYWGYDSASQLPGDGTLLMHSSSSSGATLGGDEDQPLGFELTYNHELGRSDKLRWGIEAAFGYMNVSANSGLASVGARLTTTAYPLPTLEGGGFVTPPPAPYYHGAGMSPEGNPVIGGTPVSSITDTVPMTVNGARKFDADIFAVRLGPYLEIPLSDKWNLAFSAGLSLAQVESDFSFNEAVDVAGVLPISGSGSNGKLLVGGYAAGNVNYQVNEDWGVFGGVQFQDLNNYSHTENGRTARLKMDAEVLVVFGVNYSF
jgi:hypothetical protein